MGLRYSKTINKRKAHMNKIFWNAVYRFAKALKIQRLQTLAVYKVLGM
jgi:hypothetical protein